jgi:UDP-GlcNAc:undecaprenyl-phosphate GlcNAc-1-phosphate transferase
MVWGLAGSIGIVTSWLVTWIMIVWAIKDVPDAHRKLHSVVTPTAGGVGIIAGTLLGVASLWALKPTTIDHPFIACVVLACAGGVLGFWDDVTTAGAKLKLALMVGLTLIFALFGLRLETLALTTGFSLDLGLVLGGFGTMFWLLVIVNVVNFMDGANGLAIGSSAIGLLGLAGLSLIGATSDSTFVGSAFLCLLSACACLGFLYWNVKGGRIFAGDCGALYIGLMVGGVGIWVSDDGVYPLAVALCFLPILSDAILTVIWRSQQKANLLHAHRDHVFQLAIKSGYTHLQVAAAFWTLTLLCCLAAWLGQKQGASATFGIFGVCLALCIFGFTRARAHLAAKET